MPVAISESVPRPSSFFVTGGTLRHDAPSYVERRSDKELFEALLRNEYCYVLTSRQMGKSSLMVRTANRLRALGVHAIVLDLTAVGQNLTPEQWYDGLAVRLGRHFRLEDELEVFWQKNLRLSPVQRWFTAVREVVLPLRQGQVVIFIDELDTVRSLPFSTDEFFAAIREFYNRRTEDPEFNRLTFCLLGVATPSDLIRDTRTTPFNIGRRIEMHDFTREEAAPLAEGLARLCARPDRPGGVEENSPQQIRHAAQAFLERIFYWTNGHPYLTQLLCRSTSEALDQGASMANPPALVDRLCGELFFTSRARERDDNLVFVRERILRSEVDRAALLDLYAQVRRGGRGLKYDETSGLMSVLRLSGIVTVTEGVLRERNRIYQRVFDKHWILAHMPDAELRRQRAAFRRGVLRSASVGLAILLVAVVLALIGLKQSRIARTQAARGEQLDEINLRLNVASGVQLLEQGDLLRSLPWFAEALRLDRADSGHEQTHRVRFGSVLEQAPRIVQMWFQPVHMVYGSFGTNASQVLLPDSDGRSRLWDVATGRAVTPAVGLGQDLEKAVLSRDGRFIVTSSENDRVARLWRTETGEALSSFTHEGDLYHAEFSPDGQRIVTAVSDGTAVMWDAHRGERLAILTNHAQTVQYAGFDPNGRRVLTAGRDNKAVICDSATGQVLATLAGHDSWVYHAAFSPDGRFAATGSFDRSARVWNAETGQEIMRVQHDNAVRSVEFSRDGRLLLTGGWDLSVRVWNLQTRKMQTPPLTDNSKVMHAAFSPDARHVLTVGWNGIVRLWQIQNGAAPAQPAALAVFSPDGARLATLTNQTVIVKDTLTGRVISELPVPQRAVAELLFSQNGRWLITVSREPAESGGAGPEAQLWDTASGERAGPSLSLGDQWTQAHLNSAGDRLLASGRQELRAWDARSGALLLHFTQPDRAIRKAQFDSAGKKLAVIAEQTVQLWDLSTGQKQGAELRHPVGVTHAEFSPDGRWLVTTCSDNDLDAQAARLWNAETGERVGPDLQHRDGVLWASFSPDGRRLVTASEDFTSIVWDIPSGQQLTPPLKHENEIYFAGFSPDGRWIATAGRDQIARIWDAATGEAITPPFRHPNVRPRHALFVARNRFVVTQDTAGGQWIWQLPSDERPVDDLVLVAQLLSAQYGKSPQAMISGEVTTQASAESPSLSIEAAGGFRPLTEGSLQQIWQTLRQKYPAFFSVSP